MIWGFEKVGNREAALWKIRLPVRDTAFRLTTIDTWLEHEFLKKFSIS
jgi:hypothetical protein